MSSPTPESISHLLETVVPDDPDSLSGLITLFYDELRQLARGMMRREAPGGTLDSTDLVHEAVMRMARMSGVDLAANERQFFGAAALAMRRILVDRARRRSRKRPLPDLEHLLASRAIGDLGDEPELMLALDRTLDHLQKIDPRRSEIVNLRFFAGLSNAKTAAALGVSERTVKREWQFTRTWLFRRLGLNES